MLYNFPYENSKKARIEKVMEATMEKFEQMQREAEKRFQEWEDRRWKQEQEVEERRRREEREHELRLMQTLAQSSATYYPYPGPQQNPYQPDDGYIHNVII